MQIAHSNQPNDVVSMIIVCTSGVAAGQVIMLLRREDLWPAVHFRVRQIDYGGSITITIASLLSVGQEAQLRAEIATIRGASIQ